MRFASWGRKDPVAVAAASLALTLLFLATVHLYIRGATLQSIDTADLERRLLAPSWLGGGGGLLGTDTLGRDLFLRICMGLRLSFLIAVSATLLSAAIGAVVGLISGYVGGIVDTLLMRFTDIYLSLPGLLLIMAIARVSRGGVLTLIIVLAVVSWPVFARLMRGPVLSMRRSDMIMATEGLGAGTARILIWHVLPNMLSPFVALGAIVLAGLMLAEASLSFLGFGLQPPNVSLGLIINEGRDYLQTAWWISTFSGLFLAATVLSTTLLGRALSERSDPRQLGRTQ